MKMANEIVKVDNDQEAYALMDAQDEAQIIAQAQGRIDQDTAGKLYYTIPVGGQRVEGISKAGFDEMRRYLADKGVYLRDIGVDVRACPMDDRYVLINATVAQFRGVIQESVAIGTKRQCRFIIKAGNVTDRENLFWYEAGAAKAIRNAIAKLVPARLKEEYLLFLKGVRTKNPVQRNQQNVTLFNQPLQNALPPATQRRDNTKAKEPAKPVEPPKPPAQEMTRQQLIDKYTHTSVWRNHKFPYKYVIMHGDKPFEDMRNYTWFGLAENCARAKAAANVHKDRSLAIHYQAEEGKQLEVPHIWHSRLLKLNGVQKSTGDKILESEEVVYYAKCDIIYNLYSQLKEQFEQELTEELQKKEVKQDA
jgi:hypothetical protein